MNDPHLLTDIRLVLREHQLRPVYGVDSERGDLALESGRANLGQAAVMRLLTPRGELAALGHPEYGSRLHELIGAPNSATKRNLAKLHILEALAAEPRIESIEDVTVEEVEDASAEKDVRKRGRVEATVTVKAVGDAGVVTIGPFRLERAP